MTTAVTKESLIARIADLECGARSLKEDYTLAAYKMLLATMEAEPVASVVPDKMTAVVACEHDYVEGWNACRAAMLNQAQETATDNTAQPATIDSDPIVEMFVAEIVKHLVSALERPVVLGPVTVNSDTDHLLLEREVIAVLGPRYPMFNFTGLSSSSYLHIGIAATLNQK